MSHVSVTPQLENTSATLIPSPLVPGLQAAGGSTWCRCPRWRPARGTWPWPQSSAVLWPRCCWRCWCCVSSTARDSCWRRSPAVSGATRSHRRQRADTRSPLTPVPVVAVFCTQVVVFRIVNTKTLCPFLKQFAVQKS